MKWKSSPPGFSAKVIIALQALNAGQSRKR
jgi:hypothetical protein